ncbi:MAG: hypothetical protein M2R45_01831 [Verrucomicrobia subdivision 3 bacterium]|nr:hypothetical protein [Limisphaerales bacterium]MCS1415631.1 hypothetical protein [Limisphaerales bacterium]
MDFTFLAELGFVFFVGTSAAVLMVVVTLCLPRIQVVSRRTAGEKMGPRSATVGGTFIILGSFSLLTYLFPIASGIVERDSARIGLIQCNGVVFKIMVFPYLRVRLARWGYRRWLIFGIGCLVVRHCLFVFSEFLWLLFG